MDLADITPRGRVDIHFHLLPGVDDGPETIADSMVLAAAALEDGTGTVVVTPHVRHDFVTDALGLQERVRDLQAVLAAEGILLAVRCGGELGLDMVGRLCQDELEAIAQGPPGARWLLVETPFEGLDQEFHGATDELRQRGFGVVLAHPERSADALLDGATGLRREIHRGARAQVNALSVLGRHGPEAEAAAVDLIRAGLVSAVASDAHGPTRPPALSLAQERLVDMGVPETVAHALTVSTPRDLLARGVAPLAPVGAGLVA